MFINTKIYKFVIWPVGFNCSTYAVSVCEYKVKNWAIVCCHIVNELW